MVAVQALEKRTAEIKQKEAQIAVLASKVEELTAKYAYLESVAARLEGVTIPPNVLVRSGQSDQGGATEIAATGLDPCRSNPGQSTSLEVALRNRRFSSAFRSEIHRDS